MSPHIKPGMVRGERCFAKNFFKNVDNFSFQKYFLKENPDVLEMWNGNNVLRSVLYFPWKCHLTGPIEALWSVAAILFVVYETRTMWCIFCVTTIKRLLSVCYGDDDAVQYFYDKLTLFFALRLLLVVWSFLLLMFLFFFHNDVLEKWLHS